MVYLYINLLDYSREFSLNSNIECNFVSNFFKKVLTNINQVCIIVKCQAQAPLAQLVRATGS